MTETDKVTCRNCNTVSINDEEFCPKCHFRLRVPKFERNEAPNSNALPPANNINSNTNNQNNIQPGITQAILDNQLNGLFKEFIKEKGVEGLFKKKK